MYSKELLKGTLKPIILRLLQENGKMYGYEIAQKVKALSEEKILIKEGSLYPSLHSMTKEGLLETESEQVGNRTRKYYRLTQKGQAKVPAMIQEVRDFMDSLKLVLQLEINQI
jgi:PadR family transcriptional regulator PadR